MIITLLKVYINGKGIQMVYDFSHNTVLLKQASNCNHIVICVNICLIYLSCTEASFQRGRYVLFIFISLTLT